MWQIKSVPRWECMCAVTDRWFFQGIDGWVSHFKPAPRMAQVIPHNTACHIWPSRKSKQKVLTQHCPSLTSSYRQAWQQLGSRLSAHPASQLNGIVLIEKPEYAYHFTQEYKRIQLVDLPSLKSLQHISVMTVNEVLLSPPCSIQKMRVAHWLYNNSHTFLLLH